MIDDIPTVDSERDPEYVGAHSGVVHEQCQVWQGDAPGTISQCENRATHTLVKYTGELHEIAACDDCGAPDDVDDFEREWSGR